MPRPLVLLHGFAATPRHWDRVLAELPPDSFDPIVLDLTEADPLTPDAVADMVAAHAPDTFTLAGYSMGGRLALHVALSRPRRIARLVLVSTSAGIEDTQQRAARLAADRARADEIERSSIESFIERWAAVPLFAQDPESVRAQVAADERRCTPAGLAALLRGLGPGAMAPMWARLGELAMPVAVLAGERDTAYVAHARRMAAAIPQAELAVIPAAGHRLALEAPGAVAAALAGG